MARWLLASPAVPRCAAVFVGLAISIASANASASPAVEGTRNLAMGATRASASGTNAVLVNPSSMPFQPTFAIEPMYQLQLPSLTHGLGFVIMDSLNNPRVSLGVGYAFMHGSPKVTFATNAGEERELELSRFGHEAMGALSVTAIRNWMAIAIKPKYQYSSLRYHDDEGLARDANKKLSAFGLDTSVSIFMAGWAEIALIGNNLTGNYRPAYTDERPLSLEGVDLLPGTIDTGTMPAVSDYPLTFEHGLAVFPLNRGEFSLNFDGVYDFTTYKHKGHTRMVFSGAGEFIVGPVPIRVGVMGDLRDKPREDDRIYVSGGVGYLKPAKIGGVGVDAGFGFRQQVSGPDLGSKKETLLIFNIGLRIHPDV